MLRLLDLQGRVGIAVFVHETKVLCRMTFDRFGATVWYLDFAVAA